MMANTCLEAEYMMDYDRQHVDIRTAQLKKGVMTSEESVACSAVQTAYDIGAKVRVLCVYYVCVSWLVAIAAYSNPFSKLLPQQPFPILKHTHSHKL